QLLFSRVPVFDVNRTERATAHVDLALLANDNHYSFRVPALFRLGQQDSLAVECRLYAALLQAFRRRQIGIEELLEKGRRRLLAGAPLGVILAALGVKLSDCFVERGHDLSRPSLRGSSRYASSPRPRAPSPP